MAAPTIRGIPIRTDLAGGQLRWAHHPHCDRHAHHLLWLGSVPVCLGCAMMSAGVVVGACASWLAPWGTVGFAQWLLLHLALIAPTALQPLVQVKAYKASARFLLGAGTASYLLTGLWLRTYLEPAWAWRALVLAAFAAGFFALYTWRRKRLDDPCASCPLGYFPTCDWNMPRLLEANAQLRGLLENSPSRRPRGGGDPGRPGLRTQRAVRDT